MGWFDEQIKQRKLSDQELFEDSFMQVASSIMGSKFAKDLSDSRYVAKQAIDEVLRYYHFKPVEIPDSVTDFEDEMEYALRPHGLMWRRVKLTPGWYKDGFGLLLSQDINGKTLILYPNALSGYYYNDPVSGKKVRINRHNAEQIAEDAFCFYQPLPLKKLTVRDLIVYMLETLDAGDLARVAVITLIATLFGMISPRLNKILMGPVLNSRSYSVLLSLAVFMVCTSFTTQMINVIRSLLMSRIDTKTSLSVEAAVMMRILSLRPNFFRQYSSGELSSRANSVKSICSILLSGFFMTGISSLMSLLYVGQIFTFAPVLVVPSLMIIITTISLGLVSTFMQISINREEMKLNAQESGMSFALLNGIQKIRLSGSEKRTFARWAKLYAKEAEHVYNPPTFLKLNGVLLSAIALVGNIVLYYLAVSSGISQSDYFAFNAAYGNVSATFSSLAAIILSFAQMKPIMEMAEPILNEVPEVSEGKEVLTSISGAIEMNSVSFAYEENTPLVVDDLSLRIRAGEYVAIVGKTGCGKSTLIRLLLGFEKPDRGAIYFDGKDMNKIDLKSLRRKIGTVMQNGDLFTGDIYSNIAISAPDLTMEGAWEAAELAGIADDIRHMPMGMQTLVAEGTGGISGGQKQRIMIARAVAPKPKVLIFDEATSALDNVTQKKISEALDALKCTRIVIAHRLSTIRNADRILVLDHGKIIEDGTYDELIEQNGFFAELVDRQRLDK